MKVVSEKRWCLVRGNLVWDICAFIPSKAGLTKEVVFHKGGLLKGVLLYFKIVTMPHNMIELGRMLGYKGVGLQLED